MAQAAVHAQVFDREPSARNGGLIRKKAGVPREPAKEKPRRYAKSLEGNGSDEPPAGGAGAVSEPLNRYGLRKQNLNPPFGRLTHAKHAGQSHNPVINAAGDGRRP